MPHHQDTGGFFVAVLEKVKTLPWESEITEASQSNEKSNDDNKGEVSSLEDEAAKVENEQNENKKRGSEEVKSPWGPQRKRKRVVGYREDPFVFFKEDEDVWSSIK